MPDVPESPPPGHRHLEGNLRLAEVAVAKTSSYFLIYFLKKKKKKRSTFQLTLNKRLGGDKLEHLPIS